MADEISNSINWNRYYEMGYKPGDVIHFPVVPTMSAQVISSDSVLPALPTSQTFTVPYPGTATEAATSKTISEILEEAYRWRAAETTFRLFQAYAANYSSKKATKPAYNNDF